MIRSSSTASHRRTTTRAASRLGLVLAAVALGALASGCVLDHDPRGDGSHLDAPRHSVIASSDDVKVR